MVEKEVECEHQNLPWSLIDTFDEDDEFPMGTRGVVKRGKCEDCGEDVMLTYGEPDHPEPLFLPEEDEEVQALFAMSPEDQEAVKQIASAQREQYIELLRSDPGRISV